MEKEKFIQYELYQKINNELVITKYKYNKLEIAQKKQKELNDRLRLCGYCDRDYIIAKNTIELL